jgi:hypothetical protein
MSCVVHGLSLVPHPVMAGGRLNAKSSYAVSWKLRIWALAWTRPVAVLAPSVIVRTTDVIAPMTINPIALAMMSSISV